MKMLMMLTLILCLTRTVAAQQAGLAGLPAGSVESMRDTVSDHQAAIRRIAADWKRAYNRGDTTLLASMYAPEADYVSPHVPSLIIHGRDMIRENFKKGIDAGGHIDAVEILSASESCDVSYVVCTYRATNNGKTVTGKNIIVSRKIDGTWLIVVHASIVRDHD